MYLNKSIELLKALTDHLKQPPAPFDAHDLSAVSIGGRIILFHFIEETEELVSLMTIGQLPLGPARTGLVRELLIGNLAGAGTGGGIIGLEEGSDLITLARRYDLHLETPNSFIEKVAIQVGLFDFWAEKLNRSIPTTENTENFIQI